jgi:predicted Zn-dependent peptidase
MRRVTHWGLVPALLLLLASSGLAAAEGSSTGASRLSRKFRFSPLEFKPPSVSQVRMENGIVLYFLEDREIPAVEVTALLKVGGVRDPEGKGGLASLTGEVMRTGGTADLCPEEVNETLERLGATVETSIGTWYGSASLWSLREDLETVFGIFAGILRSPDFRQDMVALHKERLIEGIRRRDDVPANQAANLFPGLLYGEHHPLGKLTDSLEVRGITREDMLAFHRERVQPAGLWLGISGDISQDEAVALVREFFGDWQGKEAEALAVPGVKGVPGGGFYLIPREAEQANVLMGHLGPSLTSPNYLPLLLGNWIFGAGGIGTSRLWKEVRSDRGLAYRVRSSFDFGFDAPGTFTISVGTKTSTAVQAVEIIRAELARLLGDGVAAEELSRAKDYFVNAYPFDFTRGISIVRQTMLNDYRGLPPGFLVTYPDKIARITVDEVNAALRTHLHPDSLVTVTVGTREVLEPSLSELGRVIVLEEGAGR